MVNIQTPLWNFTGQILNVCTSLSVSSYFKLPQKKTLISEQSMAFPTQVSKYFHNHPSEQHGKVKHRSAILLVPTSAIVWLPLLWWTPQPKSTSYWALYYMRLIPVFEKQRKMTFESQVYRVSFNPPKVSK